MPEGSKLPLTAKQRDYIKILSNYPSTKEADEGDIKEYLKKVKKADISRLSKIEASELIKILLQRPTEYAFPCGKKSILTTSSDGSKDACMHAQTILTLTVAIT